MNSISANDITPSAEWIPYGDADHPCRPWTPLPGCAPIDKATANGLLYDAVDVYRGPDTPEVREHNQAALQQWRIDSEHRRQEREKRWRELNTDSNITDNKRVAGYARNAVHRIVNDDIKGDMPKWSNTLYLKAGQLAGYHQLGFVQDSETDCKAALLEAAAPWNEREESNAKTHIENGWRDSIPPDFPDYLFEDAGIPAEIKPRNAKAAKPGETNGATQESAISMPKLWNANDLKPGKPVEWLARQRIPRSAVSLLVGEEGIGKSLFWIWIVAAITTGTALPAFGIEQGQPQPVVLAVTEDDWQDTVRPRLEVAGANLDMVRLICIDDDGSGAPVFPRDGQLIIDADPAPVLVVIDPWLDTVSPDLKVRNTQDARLALHPFKEIATKTKSAILLVTHTNRLDSSNPRDLYGVSATLRQKARMSLFCIENEDGNLVVGPEKANMTQLVNATILAKQSVWHFQDRFEDEGSVPKLQYIGQSDKTIRQHVAETSIAKRVGDDETVSAQVWLAGFLRDGPQWSTTVVEAAKERGFSEDQVKRAKLKIRAMSKRVDGNGGWFMCLPEHENRQPETPR